MAPGLDKCLAVTYSHMGRPQTTIGAEQFHFRVRDGIGWFPFAIAARQTVMRNRFHQFLKFGMQSRRSVSVRDTQILGCYMVKPHGQLVLVSYTRYRASTPSLSTL